MTSDGSGPWICHPQQKASTLFARPASPHRTHPTPPHASPPPPSSSSSSSLVLYSRFWDLWSVVERSCPKVLWQNRVVWAALTFLLVLLFLVNLLGFPSNSSGALGDASSEKAEAPPTQNKLFGLSVGAKAKQE